MLTMIVVMVEEKKEQDKYKIMIIINIIIINSINNRLCINCFYERKNRDRSWDRSCGVIIIMNKEFIVRGGDDKVDDY